MVDMVLAGPDASSWFAPTPAPNVEVESCTEAYCMEAGSWPDVATGKEVVMAGDVLDEVIDPEAIALQGAAMAAAEACDRGSGGVKVACSDNIKES